MTAQKTISAASWAGLLILGLIWGGSFLSIRIALDEIGPLTVVAHRTLWAALILWGFVGLTGRPLPRGWHRWGALAVMGLINNVIPFGLLSWGQLHVETGLTSILNASAAVFGTLAAALFLRDERLTRRKLLGVGLGFAGVAVAIGVHRLAEFDPRALGQIAILGGAVSYALAGVWARLHLGGLDPALVAAGTVSGAALVAVPLAIAVEGPLTLALQPATLGAIAYYAIFATAGAYLIYYRVMAAAGSGNALLVTLMVVPVAIGLGAAVRGETLEPSAYLGLALLALGLLILSGRLARPPRP